MNAESLAVGLQRVDARFCRGVFGPTGTVATPGSVTVSFPKNKPHTLVCEWGVLVREAPLLIAKARMEISTTWITSFQVDSVEAYRTKARLSVENPPQLACGMQSWDSQASRRRMTEWSPDPSSGNAALPPLLRNELLRTMTHELIFMHTVDKVKKEFKLAGVEQGRLCSTLVKAPCPREEPLSVAGPGGVAETPKPSRKRPAASSATKVRKPKAPEVWAEATFPGPKQEEEPGREMGSNGEQCDWCGLTPAEGELGLRVCMRCHYSCCAECGAHQTRGTCYCKDSNFGEPYPPGAARRRHMTGSW